MFRKLDDSVSVAGQITAEDVADAASAGFVAIVNNRPDNEQPGQPAGAEIAAAAGQHGLAYTAIPISHGGMTEAQIVAMGNALDAAEGPLLAFCRSGTRSTFLWALARARAGDDSAEIAAKAEGAGYDLTPISGYL